MSIADRQFSRKALAKSSGYGVVAQAAHLASRLLLTPLIVSLIGFGNYAYWSLLFALLGWLGLHRIGFIAAAVPLASRAIGEERVDEAESYLRGSANFAIILSTLIFGLIYVFSEETVVALGVTEDSLADSRSALLLTLGATSISLVLGGYQSVLEATNRIPLVRTTSLVCALIESAAAIALLYAGAGILGLAAAYCLRLALQTAAFVAASHRYFPGLKPWPGYVPRKTMGRILRFGGGMQLIGFLHLSIAFLDRLLIVSLLGLTAAGVFEVSRKLVSFSTALAAQGLAPIEPTVARLTAASPSEIVAFMSRSARMISFLGIAPLIWLSTNPNAILSAWLGTSPQGGGLVLCVFSAAAYFHLMTGPFTSAMRGLANPRPELIYSLVWLALLVILTKPGHMAFGWAGVLSAAALSQGVASILQIIIVRKPLNLPTSLVCSLLLKPLVAAIPAVLVAYLLPHAIDWSPTRAGSAACAFFSGTLTVAVYLPVAWHLVLDGEDRLVLLNLLFPRRVRVAAIKGDNHG